MRTRMLSLCPLVLVLGSSGVLAQGLPAPPATAREEVKAFVILEAGATVTGDELVAWAKNQMASYKYPRIVEIVESLPMTATGKILKRELS